MVDNRPEPEGEGVVIDHKSMATVLQLIYIPPDWIVHCHSYKNYCYFEVP